MEIRIEAGHLRSGSNETDVVEDSQRRITYTPGDNNRSKRARTLCSEESLFATTEKLEHVNDNESSFITQPKAPAPAFAVSATTTPRNETEKPKTPICLCCMEHYSTKHLPMVLSCGHGMCLPCAKKFYFVDQENHQDFDIRDSPVRCTQCRRMTTLAPAWMLINEHSIEISEIDKQMLITSNLKVPRISESRAIVQKSIQDFRQMKALNVKILTAFLAQKYSTAIKEARKAQAYARSYEFEFTDSELADYYQQCIPEDAINPEHKRAFVLNVMAIFTSTNRCDCGVESIIRIDDQRYRVSSRILEEDFHDTNRSAVIRMN